MEAEHFQNLEFQRQAGEVLWHAPHSVGLRLADRTFYYPDAMVVSGEDSVLEIHEVKGFWEDDALVKIKVAAEMYPFRFVAWTKNKKEWKKDII
jgi:hypothetical protein